MVLHGNPYYFVNDLKYRTKTRKLTTLTAMSAAYFRFRIFLLSLTALNTKPTSITPPPAIQSAAAPRARQPLRTASHGRHDGARRFQIVWPVFYA